MLLLISLFLLAYSYWLISWYNILHICINRKLTSYITLLKSSLAVILLSSYFLRINLLTSYYWEFYLLSSYFIKTWFSSFISMSVYYYNVVWVKSEALNNITWIYTALGSMTRFFIIENSGIIRIDLEIQWPKKLG